MDPLEFWVWKRLKQRQRCFQIVFNCQKVCWPWPVSLWDGLRELKQNLVIVVNPADGRLMCVSYHGKCEVVTVTLPQNVLSFHLFSVREQRGLWDCRRSLSRDTQWSGWYAMRASRRRSVLRNSKSHNTASVRPIYTSVKVFLHWLFTLLSARKHLWGETQVFFYDKFD